MGFALPTAFVILAMAAGSLIIYLVNEHRAAARDLIVPHVRFCDTMPRRTLQRRWPRWPLLFLLQLLAALLLIAAASGIYSIGSMTGQRIAIILDCSLRMKARSDDTTRFEQARNEALKILDRARASDVVTVITAGVTARALEAPSADAAQGTTERATLRRAMLALKPTDAATDLEAALDQARVFVGAAAGHIYLLTDRGRAAYEHWHEKSAGEHPPVTIQRFGKSAGNVAIAGLSIYQSPFATDYNEVRAYLTVRNTFPDPVSIKYQVWLADRPLATGTRQVKADYQETIVIDGCDGPGLVRARLDFDDVQPADNEAFGLVTKIQPLKVLVVGPNTELKQQLEREFSVRPNKPGGFELVFDHETPGAVQEIEKRARRRSYDIVIFDAPQPGDAFRFPAVLWNGGKSGQPAFPPGSSYWIVDWNANHELMRYLENFNVPVLRATTSLAARSRMETILEGRLVGATLGGNDLVPVVSAGSIDAGRAVYFGFDLKEYSLRKYQHLKILVLNALKWLHPNSIMPAHVPVGGAYPLYGRAREAGIELRKPDGTVARLAPGMLAIEGEHISQIGPYQISVAGSAPREFVASVTDRSETFDLAVDADPIWHSPDQTQRKRPVYGPIDRSPMYASWLLALIILLIEGFLFALLASRTFQIRR